MPGPPPFSSLNSTSRRKGKSKIVLLALFLRGFAKADAGPAAVLVDERDAGHFQGTPRVTLRLNAKPGHRWLTARLARYTTIDADSSTTKIVSSRRDFCHYETNSGIKPCGAFPWKTFAILASTASASSIIYSGSPPAICGVQRTFSSSSRGASEGTGS